MQTTLRSPATPRAPMGVQSHGRSMQRSVLCNVAARPSPPGSKYKAELVDQLLQAKKRTGKTFSQIATECGLNNVYVAQLFFNQAQLKPEHVNKLQRAVPTLSGELVDKMQQAPSRRFDPDLIQEPAIYRLYEAIMHGGEALKAVINEECGDGIMSAIDFYCSIDTVPGKQGEKRVVITMNGKYLPYVAQNTEDDVAFRKPAAPAARKVEASTWPKW